MDDSPDRIGPDMARRETFGDKARRFARALTTRQERTEQPMQLEIDTR